MTEGAPARRVPSPAPKGIAEFLRPGDASAINAMLSRIKDVVIPHARFAEAIAVIDELRMGWAPGTKAPADYLLLRGDTRSGKSTALKYYERRFPPQRMEDGWKRPVVYVELQPQSSVSVMLEEIMKALGVPMRQRTIDRALDLILHQLDQQEVEVLILDEFQHLVDQRTNKFQYKAGDELKRLLNANVSQLVFGGMPVSDIIRRVNPQADARAWEGWEMAPYDRKVPKDRLDFERYVRQLAKEVPLPFAPPITDEGLMERIHLATGGFVGQFSRLLRKAAAEAMWNCSHAVTEWHFWTAYDKQRKPGSSGNPFHSVVKETPQRVEIRAATPEESSGLKVMKRRTPLDSFAKRS